MLAHFGSERNGPKAFSAGGSERLFVLGVIAVLVVLWTNPALNDPNNPVAFPIRGALDILLVFWGGYAFLTVIGLSADVFGKRLSDTSYLIGLYAFGCAVACCVSFLLLYLAAYVITALFLYFTPCEGSVLCALVNALAGVVIMAEILIFGSIPAFLIPPILVARNMAPRYGRGIWKVCAGLMAIIAVGECLFILGSIAHIPAIWLTGLAIRVVAHCHQP
jgi:hypothetical protein